MSRIGKTPVDIPGGVTVTVNNKNISVQGPKGTLTYDHRPEVTVEVEDNQVVVKRQNDSKASKAYHGLTRSLVQNMVIGVNEGYKKELEINGVGWGAQLQGRKINLKLGYADTRVVEVPNGVDVTIEGNKITFTGIDKQAVGQVAAETRAHRPPEPYNGKGVKYVGEVIIRKEGKAFGG